MKTFKDITTKYHNENCWGLSSAIDIKNCNKTLITSEEFIYNFIGVLCKKIDMVTYGAPVIKHFGNCERVHGYSFMQLIETSCITGHFSELTNNAYIDIFSCKLYDPYKTANFCLFYFGGDDVNVDIILRK